MSRTIPEIFADFDSGKISRRQLLLALGAAAVALPGISLAQGTTAADSGRAGRGGRGGRGGAAAPRDTMPLIMPFEPTGWKPVWLDHSLGSEAFVVVRFLMFTRLGRPALFHAMSARMMPLSR